MEPLFQLVGCIVSSKPAADRVDAFVLQVRRERAAVLAKSALGATFVRFNAADLKLVSMACRALRDRASLRFGFAVGVKESAAMGTDGSDISTRSLELAHELAAVAREGQVLVSPQLSAPLIEAGFVLQSLQVRRPGGRSVPAFLVDLVSGSRDERDESGADLFDGPEPVDPFSLHARPSAALLALLQDADRLDAVLRGLTARVDDMARRQLELDAQQQQLLGRLPVVDAFEARIGRLQTSLDGVEASVARQLAHFESRLGKLGRDAEGVEHKIGSIAERDAALQTVKAELDKIEQVSRRSRSDLEFLVEHRSDVTELRAKVDDLLGRVGDTDAKMADIEARRPVVDSVQAGVSSITHMLGDIQLNLDRLGEQRSVIDQVGERLARLDFSVQEAQNTLRALQRERDVAERIEQSLKALRARGGAWQSG